VFWSESGPEKAFPFGKEQPFLREHEWVILKLLCLPLPELAKMRPDELVQASGGRISPQRADELIRIVRLAQLPGLGSWAARLFAEAGLDEEALRTDAPEKIAAKLQERFGYPMMSKEDQARLAELQRAWRRAACKREEACREH